jgi:EAL domain-containing protein (putative c-di-GMP-specific phosphodiesterase class I)/signal transduction histidine kinase/CheY-like chemotaxis protein
MKVKYDESRLLRTALDAIPSAVLILGRDGRVVVCNRLADQLLGGEGRHDDLVSWSTGWNLLLADGQTPCPVEAFPGFIALRGDRCERVELWTQVPDRDTPLALSASAVPLATPQGAVIGAVVTLDDVTSLREAEGRLHQTERKLLHAQKMDALGRLAGGVAHDFNNLLAVIASYTHLVQHALKPGDEVQPDLAEIASAASRAATLTRQLLALGRTESDAPAVVAVNETITGVEKMLRRVVGEDVDLRLVLAPSAGSATIGAGPLEQVLLNLAINARDAMTDGGHLTIETDTVYLDDHYVADHPQAHVGRHVRLSVSDTGCGMDPATAARVFEPFFTTKDEGKGTGLGLSIVYGVVSQSGGHIELYSELGSGTTFKVYLPVAEAEAEAAEPVVVEAVAAGACVLLVEDDAGVRRAATRILRQAGFQVLAAESPSDARRLAVAAEQPIDVLLTDVVLPERSGPELAHQLLHIQPSMRVVYMSGYPAGALAHRGAPLEGCGLVAKPFAPASLIEAVAHAATSIESNTSAPVRPAARLKGRILIADDDADLRAAVHSLLGDEGLDVVTAADGAHAMAAMEKAEFDVVLSDIHMPGMNGIELLKQVRARDVDVPIVLMTAEPRLQSATLAVEYGAFRYLAKPVDGEELIKVVELAVRAGRLARLRRDALAITGGNPWRAKDLAGLEVRFEQAMSHLWLEYQPIVTASERSVRAFEALARTDEPSLKSPVNLFDAAHRLGRVVELGRLVREQAARALRAAPRETLLCVNVHAGELEDPTFYAADAPLSSVADRVILEITERETLEPGPRLEARMQDLRSLGYRIAVDDLGGGYAGLSTFSMLLPDVVKLDMALVRDVHATAAKRKTIAAMTDLCHDMGIEVVAQGIEVAGERDCLVGLGCDLLQGFLIARPTRDLVTPRW